MGQGAGVQADRDPWLDSLAPHPSVVVGAITIEANPVVVEPTGLVPRDLDREAVHSGVHREVRELLQVVLDGNQGRAVEAILGSHQEVHRGVLQVDHGSELGSGPRGSVESCSHKVGQKLGGDVLRGKLGRVRSRGTVRGGEGGSHSPIDQHLVGLAVVAQLDVEEGLMGAGGPEGDTCGDLLGFVHHEGVVGHGGEGEGLCNSPCHREQVADPIRCCYGLLRTVQGVDLEVP